jgi:hypothetical protein
MIRIMIALLPGILIMESCSREKDTDNAGLRKNAVILCRVGNADSAPLLKPEKPAMSGFILDSAIGDGD